MATGCSGCCSGQAAFIIQLEDNLEALRASTVELIELRNDVKRRIRIHKQEGLEVLEHVQVWLSRVQAKIMEVNKLLGDGEQEIERFAITGYCFKNCRSINFFKKMIVRTSESVVALKGTGHFKVVAEHAETNALNTLADDVWSYIMEEQVSIIGLIGKGGAGKTTLLKQIYDKVLHSPNDFDVVIWVAVSQDSRLENIQNDIWTALGLSDDHWRNRSLEDKEEVIFSVLRKKRYMLFLDDIRKRISIGNAGVPLPNRQNGSKIIFATRSRDVCDAMNATSITKVSPLSPGKSWELFLKIVGEENLSMHRNVRIHAQLVAKKCSGIPLNLITMAHVMASRKTPQEWENAALRVVTRYASISQVMADEVYGIVKFVYHWLPDRRVRSCFLYCALFPGNFKIYKDNLVDYWICEGFWDDFDNENDAREMSYSTIDFLVHSCLLEDGGKYVTMHDMVREVVLWMVQNFAIAEESFLVQTDGQLRSVPETAKWIGVRRMSLMQNSIQSLTEVPVSHDLVTLFLCCNPKLAMIDDNFFYYMDALTVLDLSKSSIHELPLGISKLVSLQYLNLSHTWIEQLPLELRLLGKMKCLNLEHNDLLRTIPRQVISGMPRLQVFRMFSCGISLVDDEDNLLSYCNTNVKELQHLEHLDVLSATITSASALHSFFSTNKLPGCTKALSLKCFWGRKSLNLSLIAEMERLDRLEIYHNYHLEELNVDFKAEGTGIKYPGGLSSATIRERTFSSLREVIVGKCFHLRDLTWAVAVPDLAILKVTACSEMEELISIRKLETDKNLNPFVKLEVLELEELPQLNSIYMKALPFPCLEKMKIVDCPMLTKLPLDFNSTKGLGFIITGRENWWKDVQWKDDATRNNFSRRFVQIPD